MIEIPQSFGWGAELDGWLELLRGKPMEWGFEGRDGVVGWIEGSDSVLDNGTRPSPPANRHTLAHYEVIHRLESSRIKPGTGNFQQVPGKHASKQSVRSIKDR